jgi:WD40 repeat protein
MDRETKKRRPVLLASPHHDDLFAVGKDDLRLYSQRPSADGRRAATLLHSSLLHSNSWCLSAAWCPSKERPFLIAAGTSSGRVSLFDCSPVESATYGTRGIQASDRPVRSFTATHQRLVNDVAWNQSDTRLIASALPKGPRLTRTEVESVLVWDIEYNTAILSNLEPEHESTLGLSPPQPAVPAPAPSPQPTSLVRSATSLDMTLRVQQPGMRLNFSENTLAHAAQRPLAPAASAVSCKPQPISETLSLSEGEVEPFPQPIARFGTEGAQSVAWVPHAPLTLFVGMSVAWVRVYDLRVRRQHETTFVAHNGKPVQGMAFNPHNSNFVATYTDDAEGIKVWDVRRLGSKMPAFTIQPP